MTSRSAASLASRAAPTCCAAASSVASRLRSSIEVLPPADEVHVLEQHLDLAPDQQALEGRVVDVHILDVDLLHRLRVRLDAGRAWPPRRASWRSTVSANDVTALSIRLSTLTRSRWIRLSSRSTCRKKLSPPRISVLYFAS